MEFGFEQNICSGGRFNELLLFCTLSKKTNYSVAITIDIAG